MTRKKSAAAPEDGTTARGSGADPAGSIHQSATPSNVVPIQPEQAEVKEPEPFSVDDGALFRTQIADGKYLVVYLGHQLTKRWRREIYDIAFRVVDVLEVPKGADTTNAIGALIPYFLNRPAKLRRGASSLRNKFAIDWRLITDRLPPRDLRHVDPGDLYGNCTLAVRVQRIGKDARGRELPRSASYSAVAEVIERIDGTPPCMRRKS